MAPSPANGTSSFTAAKSKTSTSDRCPDRISKVISSCHQCITSNQGRSCVHTGRRLRHLQNSSFDYRNRPRKQTRCRDQARRKATEIRSRPPAVQQNIHLGFSLALRCETDGQYYCRRRGNEHSHVQMY